MLRETMSRPPHEPTKDHPISPANLQKSNTGQQNRIQSLNRIHLHRLERCCIRVVPWLIKWFSKIIYSDKIKEIQDRKVNA